MVSKAYCYICNHSHIMQIIRISLTHFTLITYRRKSFSYIHEAHEVGWSHGWKTGCFGWNFFGAFSRYSLGCFHIYLKAKVISVMEGYCD